MKRIAVVHAILFAVVMAVLLTGCSSTSTSSHPVLKAAENEVTLAGYQAGNVAASLGSLETEVTMPLWFISGK